MAAVVVDTDVLSSVFKRDTRALRYPRHLAGQILVISFMTLAELDLWALRRNWGQSRRNRMDRFLQGFVVQPYNRQLCRLWAQVSDGAFRKGRPIGVADAWIAATARSHGIPLVTNNPSDYAGVDGLTIVAVAVS